MNEFNLEFENRKQDHLQWSLSSKAQAESLREFDQIQLIPEALPELDLEDVTTTTTFLHHEISMPIFISSMTAGHKESLQINRELALLSERKKIMMGVGSQRRELTDHESSREWKEIRKLAPKAILLGNLGLSQIIDSPISNIQRLIENLEAQALFVHLNALQECLQKEGTPQFRGGLNALEKLCAQLKVPVIVKEVGCGISAATAKRLSSVGIYAIDISGAGGTHWGRVETLRYTHEEAGREIGESFSDWGMSTVDSLLSALEAQVNCQLWASGGVRNGVEAMKMLALGAEFVGMARPWLLCLSQQEQFQLLDPETCAQNLDRFADRLKKELAIAMFCTGVAHKNELKTKKVWKWKNRSQTYSKDFRS